MQLSHVFFDGVHLARSGESMQELIGRLKRHELRGFRWMYHGGCPVAVHAPVTEDISTRSSARINRDHDAQTPVYEKEALYDSEASAPPPKDGITAGVVTLGWFEDGTIFVRADNRRGSRSMCYLRQQWKGVSLFFSWHSALGSSR